MSKKRILVNNRKEKTFAEVWGEFITSQTAKGVADITIRNYHQVLHNISKYLDIEMTLDIPPLSATVFLIIAYQKAEKRGDLRRLGL